MNRPFSKTLSGKIVQRTVLLTFAVALIVTIVAYLSMRSVLATANDAVANATANLPGEAVAPVQALADDISGSASSLLVILLLVTIIGACAAGGLVLGFARKLTAPIDELRTAVTKSASTMPSFIAATTSGAASIPELPQIELNSGDEVEDLAVSFKQMQESVAHLGTAQAAERAANDARFVNLGRRSQNLLARQMTFIDEMEKDETIPANLQRLFQIDHLATRMRRNAQSTLVLADQPSPSRVRRAVSMHQVVQAASSEIEHFDRIAISEISGGSVDGPVATDLAHLLAELLENATSFSSPEDTTTVTGRSVNGGYVLEIIDNGIGMDPEAVDQANARFAAGDAASGGTHSSPYLGHEVVARLAHRHSINVELVRTSAGGLTARVVVPSASLSKVEALSPTAQASNRAAFAAEVQTPPQPAAAEPAAAVPPAAVAPSPVVPPVHEPVAAQVAHTEPVGEPLETRPVVPEPAAMPEPVVATIDPFAAPPPSADTFSDAAAPPSQSPDASGDSAFSDSALPSRTAATAAGSAAIAAGVAGVTLLDQSPPDPVAAPAPAAPATNRAVPVADEEWAARGLTAAQRAAIEWAIQKGGSVSGVAAAPAALRPGPIDSAAVSELDTTPSGFQVRRRGEQGAMIFEAPSERAVPAAPRPPRSPEQLMAFRRGVESGRAAAGEAELPTFDNSAGEL